MKRSAGWSLTLTLALLCSAVAVHAADPWDVQQAVATLKTQYPGVDLYRGGSSITRVYGRELTTGVSPEVAADLFCAQYANVFGVDSEDLLPIGFSSDAAEIVPLMYDWSTGQHKFQLLRYGQYENGIPVFRGEVRILVRNIEGYPVVHVSSALKSLGDFRPDAGQLRAVPRLDQIDPAFQMLTEAELMIWAGVNGRLEKQPRLAHVFIADNARTDAQYRRYRFVVDAETGEVLHRESLIHHVDVEGSVGGLATPGHAADSCATETYAPFPYARVSVSGGSTAYTDLNGDFVIPNGGSSSVTVNSYMDGLYFSVSDHATSEETLSQSVTPPGPADFTHNASNSSEFIRAQVNGYLNANEIRDWVLVQNPSFPGISTESGVPVNVNRTDFYCPCNAWSDGVSINFCQTGGGCANTAFRSVLYHEYGHHVIGKTASGQGQYGEGMGDCFSMLMADDPRLGVGFQSCATGIRNANNSYQYPCSGAIHDCGQLLSGCVWSTRNELVVTEPSAYLDVLSNLTVNSIPLHTGDLITPAITVDFLTLDDDDGDLNNGTPHYDEIIAGFGAHNMVPAPPPENDDCADAERACPGIDYTGNTTSANSDGSSSCADSGASPDVWYAYTPSAGGSATFSLCTGTSYDAAISVHTGCPGTTSNEVACDDDTCSSGGPGQVTFNVSAGVTYYVRVTGWNGSAGAYTLRITGPACAAEALTIGFPNGLPEAMLPGAPASFDVLIEDGQESLQPGTAMLHYRYSGGSFFTAPLTPLGGDLFEATLPAGGCSDMPEFYISADGDSGSTVTSPGDAPTGVHSAVVGELVLIRDDEFEGSDAGWTVGDIGDTANTGVWNRMDPSPTDAQPGDDHTDAPGTQCWVTDGQGGGLGDFDVDGGKTTLKSPVMDLSGLADATVSYWRWYSNNTGSNPGTDVFEVDISANGGSSWTNVETVGPSGVGTTGGWIYHEFQVADFITPSGQVQLRFVASDEDPGSLVEAALDDLRVSSFTCEENLNCVASASWSCKEHGVGNTLCTDLGDTAGIESRIGGVTSVDILLDDSSGFIGDATVVCQNAGDVSGSVSGTSVDGNIVTVEFDPALPNGDACVVTLDCNASMCVRGLEGDVNSDGQVTTADASATKAYFGATADADSARFDLDATGTVSTADVSAIKPAFGQSAPACP